MNRKQLAASAALTLMAVLVFGAVATPAAQAATFKSLYSFTGNTDGGYPYGGAVPDAAGNLYGTAYYGGSSSYGVVYKVDTAGTQTVLYNFTGGSDGEYPFAGLLRDSAGNLYGTAGYGGASSKGVVFRVDTAGTETVLHSFSGGTSDGCYPFGALAQDNSGALYGTTSECGASGYGTVFKLDTAGKETVLHSFAGGSTDGEYPYYGAPLLDTQGNIYGVTAEGGGTGCNGYGCGILWKVSATGSETVLHSFAGGTSDGCYAYGSVGMDQKGNLYGITDSCGSSSYGTVWKVTANGTETIVHNFAGGRSDGSYPIGGVAVGSNGDLYGGAEKGGRGCGSYGCGVLWKISTKGTETILHRFAGTDGQWPFGPVFLNAQGGLYGATYYGGTYGYGTVWQFK